jgi:hypothetical protein
LNPKSLVVSNEYVLNRPRKFVGVGIGSMNTALRATGLPLGSTVPGVFAVCAVVAALQATNKSIISIRTRLLNKFIADLIFIHAHDQHKVL